MWAKWLRVIQSRARSFTRERELANIGYLREIADDVYSDAFQICFVGISIIYMKRPIHPPRSDITAFRFFALSRAAWYTEIYPKKDKSRSARGNEDES